MIYPVSKFSSLLYGRVIKPVAFIINPDTVHEHMIETGNLIQRSKIIRWKFKKLFAYQNPSLEFEKLGFKYKNPLGLSAGLDKDAKIVPLLKSIGFGFAECGSVTYGSYEGNPQPWYTRLPKSKSIIVNSGLRSEGAELVNKRVLSYKKDTFNDFYLNISIAKTNSKEANTCESGIDDYIKSFILWEKNGGAQLYTINISCPNTFGGEPFTDPTSLERLLKEVDKLNIKKPIFVKMPIDKSWADIKKLLEVCRKHNISGITFGNLYKDRSTAKVNEPFDPSVKGNFSGKPCWDASNELLARAFVEFGDRFIYSGVGGVFSAEDAYTKIKLGATFVQIITGLIFEGPTVVGQINRGLVKLLQRDGYSNITEAVGTGNPYIKER